MTPAASTQEGREPNFSQIAACPKATVGSPCAALPGDGDPVCGAGACHNRPVRLRRIPITLALGCVLALAGCGGGPKTYSAAKSRDCLAGKGVRVTDAPPSDLVASAAEGGSFTAHFGDNLVTVSFGLDRNGAQSIVRGYERFRGKNIGLTDVLEVMKNAVMLWAVHPQDPHKATIEGCLK
jgi:hypothetical protein